MSLEDTDLFRLSKDRGAMLPFFVDNYGQIGMLC